MPKSENQEIGKRSGRVAKHRQHQRRSSALDEQQALKHKVPQNKPADKTHQPPQAFHRATGLQRVEGSSNSRYQVVLAQAQVIQSPSTQSDHKKWPELAADRLAWRAMLQSGQPPPAYRAPPPTRAALPIANTRPQRSSLAATTAAMQNSVQRDAATTRLGGKKKTYQN